MDNIFKMQSLNYKSIQLLQRLYLAFEERGLFAQQMTIRAYNDARKIVQYINIKDYESFKTDVSQWLKSNKNSVGFIIAKLDYVVLENKNLAKYSNLFRVETKDLYKPRFLDTKIQSLANQDKVDREIERYKKIIQGILQDYDVAYAMVLEEIIDEQNLNDLNGYANYVDVDYMVNGFVSPQQ
jgi:hypothetical protein